MAQSQWKNYLFFFIFILISLSSYTGESRPLFACDPNNAMTKTYPFCRVSLHIGDRVKDLLGRLTLPEKIRLLVNNAAPVERLGIKGYEWWSEALHGVARSPGVHFGGEFPGATSFPQVITTAASFNASLWEEIGRVWYFLHFPFLVLYFYPFQYLSLIVLILCVTLIMLYCF